MSVRKLAACRGNNGSINSCSANEIINILTAHWGRHRGQVGCGNAISSTCASSNSLSIVKSFCQGQNTCIIGATIANFGSACPSGQEYLWVDFECVAVTTTTATTAALTTESESTAAAVTTLQYTAEPTTDFTTTLQSAAEPTAVSVTTLQSTLDPATDGPVTTSQSTAQPTSVHETTSQSAAEPTASPVTNLQFIVEPTAISVTNSQSIAEPTAIPVSNSQSVVDPTAIPATYSQAIVEQTALPVFNSQYVAEPTAISITSSQSTAPPAALPLPTLESNAESGTTKERYTTTESTEAAVNTALPRTLQTSSLTTGSRSTTGATTALGSETGAAAAMSSAALGGLLVGIFVVLIMIALVLIFRKNKVYAHEFHDDTSEHAVESGRDDSTVVENESLISETAREPAQVSITSKSGHDISAGDVNNSVKRSRQEVSQSQLSLVSEPQRVSHDGNDQQYVVARENEAQVSSSQESTCTRVSGPAFQVQKSASGAAENRSESCKDAVESTGIVKSGLQRTAADNHSESGKDMTDTALSSKSASSIKSGVPIKHAAAEVESSHSQKSVADDYQAQGPSLHDPDSADSFATGRDSARSKTALEDSAGGRENCD